MKYFYFIFLFLLLAAILFGSFFLPAKNLLVFKFKEIFNWPIWLVKSFFYRANIYHELSLLSLENQDLRAKILEIKLNGNEGGRRIMGGRYYLPVKIYSSYPFNYHRTLAINAGINQGISNSMSAVVSENILAGKVVEVFGDYSLIQTIYDDSWQLPVRIGDKEINGLFIGGQNLEVTMIPRDKPIETGEMVYAASKDFPYGLMIGEIKDIDESPAGIFKKAKIKPLSEINDLTQIFILIR